MNKIIFDKYNQIKNNNSIYKTIWSIKNNNERNNYIDYIYSTVIEDKLIYQYYRDNPNIGMPKLLDKIFFTIYFNKYTYRFDIKIYKQIYKQDNIYFSKRLIIQSLNAVLPDRILFLSNIKNNYNRNIIHKTIKNYYNKYLLFLEIILEKLSYIKEIQSTIKSYLI